MKDLSRECLFCGRSRFDGGIPLWEKVLTLRPNPVSVTVCPDCRGKHSVGEFLRRVRRVQARGYGGGGGGGYGRG